MKKYILYLLSLFSFSLVFLACSSETSSFSSEAELLFSSGFEDNVYIDPTAYENSEDYRYIKGTDTTTGFSWPINILGSSQSALHFIDDDEHSAVEVELQSVIGHDGNYTKALYSIQNYANGVTQAPYEILNITNGKANLYIRYWMKVDSQSLTQIDTWRALFEYKTIGYASGDGFRLIAYIYTDDNGHPYWHFQGDKDPQNPLWEIDNTDIAVPQNEWFLCEFYWEWSDENNGKALWKINSQVVGEHDGALTRNAQPIDFIILTQIYGDANPKYQWIDDIEIWSAYPQIYN